jgi:hypothetical protein
LQQKSKPVRAAVATSECHPSLVPTAARRASDDVGKQLERGKNRRNLFCVGNLSAL